MGRGNQQAKIDDVQLPALEDVLIANIQKVGALRFYGESDNGQLGHLTEIPAGEEAAVPGKTWKRYSGRADIKMLSGTKFVMGGLKNVKASDLNDATAQRATLLVQERKLEEGMAELERMKAEYLATQN